LNEQLDARKSLERAKGLLLEKHRLEKEKRHREDQQ